MCLKDFTLSSAVFVCECIYEQNKTLENLLRVFMCDVISFLFLFDAQHLRKENERQREREQARETPYRRQLFTTTFD